MNEILQIGEGNFLRAFAEYYIQLAAYKGNFSGSVNNTVRRIERIAEKMDFSRCDAVFVFTHPYGCSQMEEDQENTRRLLASLINHSNTEKLQSLSRELLCSFLGASIFVRVLDNRK